MFEGRKYMTRGIKEEIPLDIQIIIWGMIEDLRKKEDFEIDYLQVFELKPTEIDGLEFQRITHKQEVEPYSNTGTFIVRKPVSAKIFVISSIDENGKEYSTMMLCYEY
ncbi:DUF960 family protein [Paramaledivibacter caminithermalis]|jgi:hypothetical protein|uniref:Uncharacterized protein n=1 Tax=Paramaledivibacter caminithermalis (strain DSM 15212 / CIP 107654 / DViRD3) TaxID=1121301 RepID=A0A1M6NAS3_PARC5|nr:DUF960 family protein [Paramaledivibacter caminithermalis]SHJ92785.1 protein of unknown function [Paramaledivibacter caminithermalis DSM 15212]